MLSDMADVKAESDQAVNSLDATRNNAGAVQAQLDGLLKVARLAREEQVRRTRKAKPAPLVRTVAP